MAQGVERIPVFAFASRFEQEATCAPARTALLLAAVEVLIYAAYEVGFSQLPFAATHGLSPFEYLLWFPELIMGPAIGFALVAPPFSRDRALRDLEALRPALRGSPAQREALQSRIAEGSRTLALAATALGLAAGLAMTFYPGVWAEGAPPGFAHPDLSWGLIRNPLLLIALFRAIACEIELTRTFSWVGREAVEVDLLDRRPVRPLVRRGLRTVLMLAIGIAITSPLAFAPWKPDTWLAFLPIAFVVAACALMLPLRGVQQQIHAAKDAELDRVRARIRSEHAALLDASTGADPGRPRLADLLAWEARIERVAEWPFDAPALLRFGLYLAIPLGSWLGGALVERMLDLLLD